MDITAKHPTPFHPLSSENAGSSEHRGSWNDLAEELEVLHRQISRHNLRKQMKASYEWPEYLREDGNSEDAMGKDICINPRNLSSNHVVNTTGIIAADDMLGQERKLQNDGDSDALWELWNEVDEVESLKGQGHGRGSEKGWQGVLDKSAGTTAGSKAGTRRHNGTKVKEEGLEEWEREDSTARELVERKQERKLAGDNGGMVEREQAGKRDQGWEGRGGRRQEVVKEEEDIHLPRQKTLGAVEGLTEGGMRMAPLRRQKTAPSSMKKWKAEAEVWSEVEESDKLRGRLYGRGSEDGSHGMAEKWVRVAMAYEAGKRGGDTAEVKEEDWDARAVEEHAAWCFLEGEKEQRRELVERAKDQRRMEREKARICNSEQEEKRGKSQEEKGGEVEELLDEEEGMRIPRQKTWGAGEPRTAKGEVEDGTNIAPLRRHKTAPTSIKKWKTRAEDWSDAEKLGNQKGRWHGIGFKKNFHWAGRTSAAVRNAGSRGGIGVQVKQGDLDDEKREEHVIWKMIERAKGQRRTERDKVKMGNGEQKRGEDWKGRGGEVEELLDEEEGMRIPRQKTWGAGELRTAKGEVEDGTNIAPLRRHKTAPTSVKKWKTRAEDWSDAEKLGNQKGRWHGIGFNKNFHWAAEKGVGTGRASAAVRNAGSRGGIGVQVKQGDLVKEESQESVMQRLLERAKERKRRDQEKVKKGGGEQVGRRRRGHEERGGEVAEEEEDIQIPRQKSWGAGELRAATGAVEDGTKIAPLRRLKTAPSSSMKWTKETEDGEELGELKERPDGRGFTKRPQQVADENVGSAMANEVVDCTGEQGEYGLRVKQEDSNNEESEESVIRAFLEREKKERWREGEKSKVGDGEQEGKQELGDEGRGWEIEEVVDEEERLTPTDLPRQKTLGAEQLRTAEGIAEDDMDVPLRRQKTAPSIGRRRKKGEDPGGRSPSMAPPVEVIARLIKMGHYPGGAVDHLYRAGGLGATARRARSRSISTDMDDLAAEEGAIGEARLRRPEPRGWTLDEEEADEGEGRRERAHPSKVPKGSGQLKGKSGQLRPRSSGAMLPRRSGPMQPDGVGASSRVRGSGKERLKSAGRIRTNAATDEGQPEGDSGSGDHASKLAELGTSGSTSPGKLRRRGRARDLKLNVDELKGQKGEEREEEKDGEDHQNGKHTAGKKGTAKSSARETPKSSKASSAEHSRAWEDATKGLSGAGSVDAGNEGLSMGGSEDANKRAGSKPGNKPRSKPRRSTPASPKDNQEDRADQAASRQQKQSGGKIVRLLREDCIFVKHDKLFSDWKVLVGPTDWADHASGKEGALRYRIHSLPQNYFGPGVYELGISQVGGELGSGVRRLHSARQLSTREVVAVYVGHAENIRQRLQRYGQGGSHLGSKGGASGSRAGKEGEPLDGSGHEGLPRKARASPGLSPLSAKGGSSGAGADQPYRTSKSCSEPRSSGQAGAWDSPENPPLLASHVSPGFLGMFGARGSSAQAGIGAQPQLGSQFEGGTRQTQVGGNLRRAQSLASSALEVDEPPRQHPPPTQGAGLLADVFCRGYSLTFRWARAASKEAAREAEAKLLSVFDYAWNQQLNGERRPDTALALVDQERFVPRSLGCFCLPPATVGVAIAVQKPSLEEVGMPRVTSIGSDSGRWNGEPVGAQQRKAQMQQTREGAPERGDKARKGTKNRSRTGDGEANGRGAGAAAGGAGEHKPLTRRGRQQSIGAEGGAELASSPEGVEVGVVLSKQGILTLQEREDTGVLMVRDPTMGGNLCGADLGYGNVCPNKPVEGRRRCALHKGMKVYAQVLREAER